MSVPAKLVSFVAMLAVVFVGTALAGAAIDPQGGEAQTGDGGEEHGGGEHGGGEHGGGEHGDGALRASASGLSVSEAGLTLETANRPLALGRNRLAFRITGADGEPVTRFEEIHDRRMHFIVVRRDTSAFQHVHPTTDGSGSWTVDVDLPSAGVYRAYADFKSAGEQHTLATDLSVPGDFQPQGLPAPRPLARDGGYDVSLEADALHAGQEGTLTFGVSQDGVPVADLQDYLGAKGHLVALRDGDLAYLHVHPTAGGPGEVAFAATFPTPGTYRLFLQVRIDGEVRTVDYTLEVRR